MIHQIVGKGIKIKKWMRKEVASVVSRLGKFFPKTSPDNRFLKVILGRHPVKRFKVRFEAWVPNKTLFAQKTGDKLITTLNGAAEDIKRQLQKYKGKLRRFKK